MWGVRCGPPRVPGRASTVMTGSSDESERIIDERWMRRALELAAHAAAAGEVPVGAVVVLDGRAIGEGWNQPIGANDPTAHAEIVALREAARTLDNYRLAGATLYVTVEPCTMCAGALVHARVGRLVYGTIEPRSGAIATSAQVLNNPSHNHRVEVTGGVLAEACGEMMRGFFGVRRDKPAARPGSAASADSDRLTNETTGR
jgi:tRNA(adenine34) deaminase